MSTSLTGLTTNFFPSAQNGFTTSLASTIASGATTVPLNSVAGYTNGQVAVFVVDPADVVKKQTFTGIIDTTGVQVTSVVWTAGTNQAHSGGATVVDYVSATHISMITKGLTTSLLDQDGTMKAGAVDNAAALASDVVTTSKILNANVTTAKIADNSVTDTKVVAGFPVQLVGTSYAAPGSTATLIPYDDTPPQNTEGAEFMSQAITPKSATNILVFNITVFASSSSGSADIIVALFQDSTASALAATSVTQQGVANVRNLITLQHTMVAGTTSATTFKVRVGPHIASTVTFNGASSVRAFGAITKSAITITEYKA